MKNIWFRIEQYLQRYAKHRMQSFVFTVIGCLAEDAAARIEITRRSLKDLGLLTQIN